MYTLQIYPIAKGLPQKYFSYFTSIKISPGSLVEIKIRNRSLLGLVAAQKSLAEDKINIKTQSFPMRKIERVVIENFISRQTLEAFLNLETIPQVTLSTCLETYLPKFIWENIVSLQSTLVEQTLEAQDVKKLDFLPKIILADGTERFSEYEKIIIKAIQKGKSVTIFSPTIMEVEILKNYLTERLSKSLDSKLFDLTVFHSELKDKDLAENLTKIKLDKPLITISTPSLLPLLFHTKINIQTIILDQENSINYLTNFQRVELDFRTLIKSLTRDLDLELFLGGSLVSVDNFLNSKITFTPKQKTNLQLIDMVQEKSPTLTKHELETRTKIVPNNTYKEYSSVYFSRILANKLDKLKHSNGHALLFTKRKGLATITICEDCNQVLMCPDCQSPYVLSTKKTGERIYLCTKCKKTRTLSKSENIVCKNCGSWRMRTLGVGTEGVIEELKKLKFQTFLIDSEHTKTKKAVIEILYAWQASPTGVLVGTELAINFINQNHKVDLTAIISLDSLMTIPNYTMDEQIFALILNLAEKININIPILIQTRLPEQDLWPFILDDQRVKFLEQELATRKVLNLPPYSQVFKFKLSFLESSLKPKLSRVVQQIFIDENLEPVNLTWEYDAKVKQYVGSLFVSNQLLEIEKDKKNIPTSLARKLSSLL